MTFRKHEFDYALKAVTEENDQNLGEIVSTKITTSSRKPPIVARSANQRASLRQFKNTTSFLGLDLRERAKLISQSQLAVAALKKEQVARIILTRPAVEAGEALGFLPG